MSLSSTGFGDKFGENYRINTGKQELAFLINDGTKLVHKASLSLDVWAEVNSVTEKDGKVIVDMYVHQEGDCNAGPTIQRVPPLNSSQSRLKGLIPLDEGHLILPAPQIPHKYAPV